MRVGNMLVASYELDRINWSGLSNEVTLYINPTEVMIHDYSIGDDCERFFGRDDTWIRISPDARLICGPRESALEIVVRSGNRFINRGIFDRNPPGRQV